MFNACDSGALRIFQIRYDISAVNMKKTVSLLKPFDIVICAAVIVCAVVLWFLPVGIKGGEGDTVVVTTDDKDYSYALADDAEYVIESRGYTVVIRISDKCVYVAESDCKDGVCVKSGKISKPGETIICAPARVCIRISGSAGVNFDAET